jgi:hypothetical protein
MDKVDRPDSDKTELIKMELFMDPENPASKYSRNFVIFKDGCKVQRNVSSYSWVDVD